MRIDSLETIKNYYNSENKTACFDPVAAVISQGFREIGIEDCELLELLERLSGKMEGHELMFILNKINLGQVVDMDSLKLIIRQNHALERSFSPQELREIDATMRLIEPKWNGGATADVFWKEMHIAAFGEAVEFPEKSWEENYAISYDTVMARKEIEGFYVEYCGSRISPQELVAIIAKYPKTAEIGLKHCSVIFSPAVREALDKTQGCLKRLSIHTCGYHNDDGFTEWNCVDRDLVNAIANCKSLEWVYLRSEKQFESAEAWGKALSNVKSVQIDLLAYGSVVDSYSSPK